MNRSGLGGRRAHPETADASFHERLELSQGHPGLQPSEHALDEPPVEGANKLAVVVGKLPERAGDAMVTRVIVFGKFLYE